MNIRVRCFTDLEEYKDTIWPPVVATLPHKGNYMNGIRGGKPVCLRVDEIYHGMTKHEDRMGTTSGIPLIGIKLIK